MVEPTPARPPTPALPGQADGGGFVRGYSRYDNGEYQWVRCYWRYEEHRPAQLTADEIDHMRGWLHQVIDICQQRIMGYEQDRADLQDRLNQATGRYEREELVLQIQMVDGQLDDEQTQLAGAQRELRKPTTVRQLPP